MLKVDLAGDEERDGFLRHSGVPVTKPGELKGLFALGGPEESSGYKGYGLAMMVEILCGILSGSHFGPWIRSWKASSTEANLGQCFIAIDPNAFEDEFEERLQKLINYCRALPPSGRSRTVDERLALIDG